eukprot:TRINITY_DN1981_c0_g2_i2.p1 TRINITY_DN1981_c0_g2~~TRINITY_DN1981_c0_g2_i2.p1  ORF type:complete len:327 (+),score=41.32 TRINITY_DN1981_c0_g2_i2:74-1054(+)
MQSAPPLCSTSWGEKVDLPQNASTLICVLVPSREPPTNPAELRALFTLFSSFGEMASWQVNIPSDPNSTLVEIQVEFFDVRAAHKAVQQFGSTRASFCEPGPDACRTICVLPNVPPPTNGFDSFGEVSRLSAYFGGSLVVVEFYDVRAARKAQLWALENMPFPLGFFQDDQASSDAQLIETEKVVEVDSVQSCALESMPPPGILQCADPVDKGNPPEFCHVQFQASRDVHLPCCSVQPAGERTLHPHGLHPDSIEVEKTPHTQSEASEVTCVPCNSSLETEPSEKSYAYDQCEDFYVPSETSEDVAERQEYLAWLMSEGAQDDSAP